MTAATSAAAAIATARRVAEEVLWPAALETDRAEDVPRELLDELAAAGLYGIFAPIEVGGLGLDRSEGETIVEALASGCLTTTFVWIQHQSTAGIIGNLTGPLAEEWARPLATGERRAGIAFSHLRNPDPTVLTAEPVAGGYLLHGTAPLVTGWGLVDALHVATRLGPDVVWLLVDAVESPTLLVRRLDLAAMNASATVVLRFTGHFVPDERRTVVQTIDDWFERDAAGLRTNGSLSLGVAGRAISLLSGEGALTGLSDRLDAARLGLAAASIDELPAARADASLIALDAAAALVAATGGRSMVRDAHGQLLARWAMFLLVQGQTPPIRAEQLSRLADRR